MTLFVDLKPVFYISSREDGGANDVPLIDITEAFLSWVSVDFPVWWSVVFVGGEEYSACLLWQREKLKNGVDQNEAALGNSAAAYRPF